MKNIRIILLGQLLLVILVFVFCICLASDAGMSAVTWFIDFPSLITILIFLIPGLLIMGAWKDFIKSFSVGIKKYNLLELKNIISAIGAAQKFGLTKRELELGFLKVSGFSNRRIAYMFGISEQTVKNHFTHIYEKAWVPGRKEFQELFIQNE